MSVNLTAHDATELIHKKITTLNLHDLSWEAQVEIAEIQCAYYARVKKQLNAIRDITKRMSTILEQQLKEFTTERQDEYHRLNRDVVTLQDTRYTPEERHRLAELAELSRHLCSQSDAIEATIPDQRVITNYKATIGTCTAPTD